MPFKNSVFEAPNLVSTKTLLLKHYYSRQGDIPTKSLVFLGFEGTKRTFGPHPFTWKTLSLGSFFLPEPQPFFQGAAKRSAAKGVRSLFFVFGTLLVTFRSLFLILLSLFSSLLCQTPFAGLLLRQG